MLTIERLKSKVETMLNLAHTGEEMREAELKNLACMVQITEYHPEKRGEILREVRERLEILLQNPDYAGKHEHHKLYADK